MNKLLPRKAYQLKVRLQGFRCVSRATMMTKCWNPRNDAPASPTLTWKK